MSPKLVKGMTPRLAKGMTPRLVKGMTPKIFRLRRYLRSYFLSLSCSRDLKISLETEGGVIPLDMS